MAARAGRAPIEAPAVLVERAKEIMRSAWGLVMNVDYLLARVGLVAAITSQFVAIILATFPFTLPANAWYSPVGFVGLAVVAGLAIAAFRIATRLTRVARREWAADRSRGPGRSDRRQRRPIFRAS